jgi:ATP-dependent protease ClpP protease subunit
MSVIAEPQKRIISILKDVTGLTTQEIRKILKRGEVVSAKEAKRIGLLDEIQ